MANASAVPNLANSDGCSLKGPMGIHEVAPFTAAVVSTTRSNTRKTPYMAYAAVLNRCASVSRINSASKNDMPIHSSCLPCCDSMLKTVAELAS